MLPSTALNTVLENKEIKDQTLVDWLDNSDNATQVKKFKGIISAIEKIIKDAGFDKYTPLSFSVCNDKTAVSKIHKCLINCETINDTTRNNYMSCIDSICSKAKNIVSKPFKSEFKIPAVIMKKTAGRTFLDIATALNKVKTRQDYEAIILWLLKFSLRGVDMVDLANISEERIEANTGYKKPNHYFPEYNLFGAKYRHKSYFVTRRKKTKDKSRDNINILFNLFPSLILLNTLKGLISITHPEYAYTGKDKYRLFNFTTLDSKDNEIAEGIEKLKRYRDTMSTKCKKLTGAGLQNTRHTFTQTAEKIQSANELDLSRLVGHKKGAIHHYTSEEQTGLDLLHIQTLQDFNFLKLVKLVIDWGRKNGNYYDDPTKIVSWDKFGVQMPDNVWLEDDKKFVNVYASQLEAKDNLKEKIKVFEKHVPKIFSYKDGVGGDFMFKDLTETDYEMLMLETYNHWSYTDELEYQTELKKWKSNGETEAYLNEQGIVAHRKAKMSNKLKALIQKKQDILSVPEVQEKIVSSIIKNNKENEESSTQALTDSKKKAFLKANYEFPRATAKVKTRKKKRLK